MTSPDEALRLAQDIIHIHGATQPRSILEKDSVELARAYIALSTRSCSECAEFKRMEERAKHWEAKCHNAWDQLDEAIARAQRAEAAERALKESQELVTKLRAEAGYASTR